MRSPMPWTQRTATSGPCSSVVLHVGGDRFAATMVVLPEGLYFGRLGTDSTDDLVDTYPAGTLVLPTCAAAPRSRFRRRPPSTPHARPAASPPSTRSNTSARPSDPIRTAPRSTRIWRSAGTGWWCAQGSRRLRPPRMRSRHTGRLESVDCRGTTHDPVRADLSTPLPSPARSTYRKNSAAQLHPVGEHGGSRLPRRGSGSAGSRPAAAAAQLLPDDRGTPTSRAAAGLLQPRAQLTTRSSIGRSRYGECSSPVSLGDLRTAWTR
ncbi:hypothetical protein RR21198_0024 [Rhodococcus rhodochrous ATCC 21198]|nr:hypothetical protein RR21198_0024 [Rhodococcus rhodochrous ATCC 21198]